MKTLKQVLILLIISIYCSGCAVVAVTALGGAIVLGTELATNSAEKGIKKGIENKREGFITVTNVLLTKSEIESNRVLTITGTLQVSPGTKNNERFRNLSSSYFVFLLYDAKSQLLKRIYQKIDSVNNGDLANVEVNVPHQFTTHVEKVPNSLFTMTETIKFEEVSNSVIENSERQTLK